jgi:hypothetical protein
LVDLEFDVELTGFEMGEIDIILSDSDEAKDEVAGPEDDVPEPLPDRIVSRLGDIWILGKHRLHCGDARDQAAYDQLLTGDKAELVVTDSRSTGTSAVRAPSATASSSWPVAK